MDMNITSTNGDYLIKNNATKSKLLARYSKTKGNFNIDKHMLVISKSTLTTISTDFIIIILISQISTACQSKDLTYA
jgi:hypothetical protein